MLADSDFVFYPYSKGQSLDFNRSFLSWLTKAGSYGRFSIASTCSVGDAECCDVFYLGTGIKAGNVYAPSGLPKFPVYDFQLAASLDRFIIYRDYERGQWFDTVARNKDNFDCLNVKTSSVQVVSVQDWRELSFSAHYGHELVANIVFEGWSTSVSILFPINHLNLCRGNREEFQVETGPILLPVDLQDKQWDGEFYANLFVRGFIFFNRLDYVEIIVQSFSRNWWGKRVRMFGKTVKTEAKISIMRVVRDTGSTTKNLEGELS